MCVSYVILQGCDMCIVYHLLYVILNKTKRVWLSSFDIAAIIIACYIASQMPSGPETGRIMGGSQNARWARKDILFMSQTTALF